MLNSQQKFAGIFEDTFLKVLFYSYFFCWEKKKEIDVHG